MLACRLWEHPPESLWFCFTNSLRQLPSLPRAFVLHIMRHFSKLLEVLETLLHGRKMKATRPEMPALCRGDSKSLVPALTNSTHCKGWADCLRPLYQLQENNLLHDKRSTSECHPFWHASPLSIYPLVLLTTFFTNHPWYWKPFTELFLQYWFEFRCCPSHSLLGIKLYLWF